jgi:hypothetical protein
MEGGRHWLAAVDACKIRKGERTESGRKKQKKKEKMPQLKRLQLLAIGLG